MRVFVRLDPTTETDGRYFYEFSDELKLSDVIVGAGSAITRQQISTALGNLAGTVKARKARLAFKSYLIVEQRQPNLWV